MPRRPALAVTASVLGFLTSVAVAAAASTVGNPVVVNNLTGSPDANVYTFSIGAEENGRFSVLWVEDQDGDYIRDAVLTRGFNARGKAIGPIVELSNDATTEDPEALGFHALPDGRLGDAHFHGGHGRRRGRAVAHRPLGLSRPEGLP